MELNIWPGDWGIPSIDHHSLQILAYSKFSSVPLKIKPASNSLQRLCDGLPSFRHGSRVKLKKFDEIVDYLRAQNYCADLNLSKIEDADISAYDSLIKAKLEPALLYLFWMDERNYIELTRPWYAKRLALPANYYIPGRMKASAEESVKSLYGNLEDSMLETTIISEAQKCLTLLSERLKDKDFFFGRNPTSLDALIFGYLAPILKVPFVSSTSVQNHLKACGNLTRFVNRILQNYFPKEEKLNDKMNSSWEEEDEFPHKWRDMILSVLVSLGASIGFAVGVGIINVEQLLEEEDDHESLSLNTYEEEEVKPE